jgi:hypothetical protein
MKKTMLAIGAFVLVSQAAQAQERGWLERAAREGAWQTEQRLHEQQRRLEDPRLQQRRMEETANRLRYERLAAFGVL